ncbi:DDE-type integrase/transposase/recombinase [endosymbiont 'TC1' of Trimyema compressum]|uniref:DDE-type integrase/transposase/recombinase n=1 Tax=endosymbiont 'TC1' of Trimyema compressum TaxID=243899 RepID=UPI00316AC80A
MIEWELSDSLGMKFVLDSAKRFLEKQSVLDYPILLHRDQGIQYTSSAYQALLREYNVVQSMSRVDNPKDNAITESFFGRFKDVLRFQFRPVIG